MHEMSLAMEICRIAEEKIGTPACAGVVEVGVVVGREANVDPDSLAFCLEAMLREPPFGHGQPALSLVPGDDLRLDYLEVEDADPDD